MRKLLVVAVMALGGCASANTAPPVPTPIVVYVTLPPIAGSPGATPATAPSTMPVTSLAPTASPSPTATPTQDEIRAVAAKAYLAAANISNKAGDKSFKRYKNIATLAAWHALYAAYARQSRAFSLAIRAITFPEDTKADVKRLLDRDSTAETLEREINVATSWARIYAPAVEVRRGRYGLVRRGEHRASRPRSPAAADQLAAEPVSCLAALPCGHGTTSDA